MKRFVELIESVFQIGCLLFVILASCKKEETERSGNLNGTVLNSVDQPVEGALVDIDHLTSEFTDLNGNYHFYNLSATDHTVSVSKDNYLPQTSKISIGEDKTTTLDFRLAIGKAFITISDSILQVSPVAGTKEITIASNAGWTVDCKSDWLTCSKTGGAGNSWVLINWPENAGSSDRIDTVYFYSGTTVKQLSINQAFTGCRI